MTSARSLCDELRATYERAADAGGVTERRYRIADRVVVVAAVGAAIADLVDRALAPLRDDTTVAPDLTIRCWDTTTSGVALAPPPWAASDHLPGGRVRGFDDPDVPVAFDLPTGTLNVFDRGRDEAFCWTSNAGRLPSWFHRSPFRLVFGWWAAERGMSLAHAGAVGDARGVVLVTGAGGSGKSSTVFSARRAGLQILSDDLCLLAPGTAEGARPSAHALYGTAKLEPDGIDRLPELRDEMVPVGETLMVELGADLVASAPLRAVLALEIHAGASELVPVSPADCLLALAPSSILGATAQPPSSLHTMAAIVDGVPCYLMRLGPDPDDVAHAMRRLLADSP